MGPVKLLMVMLQVSVVFMSQSDVHNINTCHRKTTTLTCDIDLPDPSEIHEDVTSVFVQDYKWGDFTNRDHIFKQHRWQTVRELCVKKNKSLFELLDNDLTNLPNLEILSFHITRMNIIEKQAFAGLNKLRVLDMSGCISLDSKYVIDALINSNSTFKLDVLNLNFLGTSRYRIFTFNYDFTSALHQREIKSLSIRGTSVLFTQYSRYRSPFLLEYIDVSDCNMHVISGRKLSASKMRSLFSRMFANTKFANISGVIWRSDKAPPPQDINIEVCQTNPKAFQYLETVDVSRIIGTKWNFTKTVDISCFLYLKKVIASSNDLFVLNATMYWPPRMEYIDVSSNEMEMISTQTLQGLAFLKHLDLSSNRLCQMERHTDFSYLFSKLKSLEYLNLGNNSFTSLPVTMFENNLKLRELILRNNKLKVVSYIPITLTQITFLDLQNNMISILVEADFNILNTLMYMVNYTTGKQLILNLLDNMFVCDCESILFNSWIINKLQTMITSSYTCLLDERMVNIDDMSLNAAKYNCYKNLITISSTIMSVVITFVLSFIVYLLYDKRKKSRRQKTIQHILEKLLKHTEKHLIFISYSSADAAFVKDALEPAIKVHFKNKFDVPDKFIVTGDSKFRLGYPILSEIIRCIQLSCVIVCFVSKSFCESDWCETELREAVQQHKPTILLFKEDINRENMSNFVRMIFNRYTRAKLELKDNMYEPIGGWDHFCESVFDLSCDTFEHLDEYEKSKYNRREINRIRDEEQYSSEVEEATAFV